MLFRRGPVASRAKERKTKREKNNKLACILVAMFLSAFVSVFAFNSLANIGTLADWDTSSVADMSSMSRDDSLISSLQPIFNWNVQNSTTKTNMFYGIPSSVTRPNWYTGG